MDGSDEQRGSIGVESAGEPGPLTRLLQELAETTGDELAGAWTSELAPGDRVGRFEIRAEIGRGGFGVVYEALDPELGRSVALKTLRPGRTRRELGQDWIKREAEAVARLDHPTIVTIFDVGSSTGGPYLVEELLRGETLAQRLARGPLPVDEALRVAEEMARGLAHAHHRGVLHRDLKPSNVFLCEDGRVKLLDFGLAHLLGREGPSSGGTPAYMAPEQSRGEPVDERTDVYAAAMVLGETITGKRPIEPPSPAPGAALDLADVPRPIARAIAPGLSSDPGSRPRDGTAWLESLQAARRSLERPRTIRRIAALGGAFLALGLAVAGVATWRVWHRETPSGRVTVAVADFANETGEPDLDSIHGLLVTALEQSGQLRVLTRARMLDVLRQRGRGTVGRIDEPMALEVGRETNTRALLLATIRRLGDAYAVDMRALDPLRNEYLFTVNDRAAGKDAVFDLVDRLGQETLRRLRADGGPGAVAPRKVASITTSNPRAWGLLSRSREAADRLDLAEARRLAEDALKEDPEFALAHYELAHLAVSDHSGWGFVRDLAEDRRQVILAHVAAAERLAVRLPEKERLSLLALRAQLDGRWDDALRLLLQVAEAHPLDKHALLDAGSVLLQRNEDPKAIPYFERALALDPASAAARRGLTVSLVGSSLAASRVDWLREQAERATSEAELRTLARALLAAGAEKEALDAFRRSGTDGAYSSPPRQYVYFLLIEGRAAEAEAMLRNALAQLTPELAARDPERKVRLRFDLSLALYASGRFVESTAARETSETREVDRATWNILTAMSRGAEGECRTAMETIEGVDGPSEDKLTDPAFALMCGDVSKAGRWARKERASRAYEHMTRSERLLLDGILAWTDGSPALAEERFRGVAAWHEPFDRYLGNLMLGTLVRLQGRCGDAAAALEAARGVRFPAALNTWVFTYPLLLHSLADCYERTGDIPRARERNEELLRLWAKADPDIPLLVEAKATQARLAARTGAK